MNAFVKGFVVLTVVGSTVGCEIGGGNHDRATGGKETIEPEVTDRTGDPTATPYEERVVNAPDGSHSVRVPAGWLDKEMTGEEQGYFIASPPENDADSFLESMIVKYGPANGKSLDQFVTEFHPGKDLNPNFAGFNIVQPAVKGQIDGLESIRLAYEVSAEGKIIAASTWFFLRQGKIYMFTTLIETNKGGMYQIPFGRAVESISWN